MQRDDRRGLTCAGTAGGGCPGSPCPGGGDADFCRHVSHLQAWRSLPGEAQASTIWAAGPDFEPSTAPSSGRLRVGLWCPCLGLGGAEVWQLALARSVDPGRVGWMGAVVIEERSHRHPSMAAELGAIMPVGHGLDAARKLASACDVIVSWAVTGVGSLLAGLDDPPSVVIACHFPGESSWGPGTDALLEGVDRFVAVSELAVESTPMAIRGRVEVIWNAVEPRRLEVRRDRRAMWASWGIPPGSLVAGYLGRLSPEKDPGAMIRLAQGLPEPWHVVIAGEGRDGNALAAEARSLGLGRVHLVGGDPSAGDVLNAFDSLVVPSLYESFGLTLAEGFHAGLPVVATRSGLAKLVPGLIREVGVGAGTVELAEAVLRDRQDPGGTRERVDRARSFARDRLGLERFGRDWTELLIRSARRGKGVGSCPTMSLVA